MTFLINTYSLFDEKYSGKIVFRLYLFLEAEYGYWRLIEILELFEIPIFFSEAD